MIINTLKELKNETIKEFNSELENLEELKRGEEYNNWYKKYTREK